MIKHEGLNLGAIRKIALINLADVSFPSSSSFLFSEFIFAPGKSFLEIYFTPETASFKDSRQNSKSGHFFQKELHFSIPSVRSEISQSILSFSGMQLLALVSDFNDNHHLAFPLHLIYDALIPYRFGDYNGYSFHLAGQSTSYSPSVII
jgi:hypothetical protein